MNLKLEAALAYARMRWRIFPCHSIVETTGPACSCGKACSSPGKHPRTRGGFKDATDDPAQIRRWWTKWPNANIGLATGSGIAVFDIDGEAGHNEFKALLADHEKLPATLTAQTGRGFHLVFATRPGAPEVRSSSRGNVHVRGEGGYIIVEPSNHISGKNYQWINKVALATLPDWLRQWSQGYETANKTAGRTDFNHLGHAPAYLQGYQADVTERASEALRTQWSPSEQARIESALTAIPADGYETWFQIGMALKDLEWSRPDGTDAGFDLWDAWSQTCPEKYALGALEVKWRSFRRAGVTLGTVYHMARERGWNGGAPGPAAFSNPSPAPASAPQDGPAVAGLNGHANGAATLPAAFLAGPQAIFFPDRTEEGRIKPTMLNAKVAIMSMGLTCRFDLFHNRMLVGGELINKWNSAELSDHVVSMLRDVIRYKFGFDPKKENVSDACEILCLANRFDPVLDYLGELRWDGTPRLDRWLATYLGAADNELNAAIGRLALIAAVRRARLPGTKFDQIIILEGPQGQGKSEAIEILAGADNFSDQSILGVDDRKQQELTEGVWLYEIGELSGMRKAELEHIKAFASRKRDRARPAYGRYVVSQPRRTVFFASTNQDNYLQDDSGNRRFWPVAVYRILLEMLRRDRDQLWAEAAHREASGESHMLPERLWAVAGEEQDRRREGDDWFELIARYLAEKNRLDVTVTDVLCDNQYIQRKPDAVTRSDTIRAGAVLKRLRYFRYHKRIEGGMAWRYRKLS